MKFVHVLTPLALLVLAGCSSTPAYRCPLDGAEASGRCSSTEAAYDAAVGARGVKTDVISVFDLPQNKGLDQKKNEHAARPFFTGQATNYPTPAGSGTPVFAQPRVFQPWLAPYVDADGNLRSGEYGYFSTPGKWNYGSLRKPGGASQIFEPANPGNLGFEPKAPPQKPVAVKSASPSAPPTSAANPAAAPAAAKQVEGSGSAAITQPYQRLKSE